MAFIKMNPILLCVFLSFRAMLSNAQELIPLEKALDLALANNLQVKQAALQVALSEKDVLQAKSDLYPSANAGSSASWNWGTFFDQSAGRLITTSGNSLGASLSVSVPIFKGFQRVNQISMNKYLLMSDQSQVDKIKNDLQLAVVTTYLEALTNHDLMEASREQLTLSKEQLEVTLANFEVGNKTLADLALAKSQVAKDELTVTSARNAYELSIVTLKQLMEMDPSIPMILEKPKPLGPQPTAASYDPVTVYNHAVKYFPEIRRAEYNRLAAAKNIAIARGGYTLVYRFLGDWVRFILLQMKTYLLESRFQFPNNFTITFRNRLALP